jgi:hypothetical protein
MSTPMRKLYRATGSMEQNRNRLPKYVGPRTAATTVMRTKPVARLTRMPMATVRESAARPSRDPALSFRRTAGLLDVIARLPIGGSLSSFDGVAQAFELMAPGHFKPLSDKPAMQDALAIRFVI